MAHLFLLDQASIPGSGDHLDVQPTRVLGLEIMWTRTPFGDDNKIYREMNLCIIQTHYK